MLNTIEIQQFGQQLVTVETDQNSFDGAAGALVMELAAMLLRFSILQPGYYDASIVNKLDCELDYQCSIA